MKIEVNDELMDHLENLARLKFNEEERKIIMDDMRKILEYMELLD
ncbi:MAG: Asp-tRNA(Asn)/Glu-tRNA(Gln) amidotransferase GatCAB subunit C, partial [Thermotoga sp.]